MPRHNNEDIRHLLRDIEDKSGSLTPDAVLREATPKDHPLHDHFTWDNKQAGHKYRLGEARELIRRVRVVVSTTTSFVAAPAYVHDPAAAHKEQKYVSTVRVRSDIDRSREILIAEFRAAASHVQRARDLAAYLGLSETVDELIQHFNAAFENIAATAGNA